MISNCSQSNGENQNYYCLGGRNCILGHFDTQCWLTGLAFTTSLGVVLERAALVALGSKIGGTSLRVFNGFFREGFFRKIDSLGIQIFFAPHIFSLCRLIFFVATPWRPKQKR